MNITILLRRLVLPAIVLLVVLVIGLGASYFWKLNGDNLTWCSTHSNECRLARISDAKEVADKIEKIK